MTAFVLRRLFAALPLVLLVLVGSFLLVRLAPGDPLNGERDLPPQVRMSLEKHYGLDQRWHRQLWHYLEGVARGDLGPSYRFRDRTVNQIIRQGLPVSAGLGLLAYAIALLLGLALGLLGADGRRRWLGRVSMILAMLGISIPNFVLGPLLVLVFSFTLYWLPPAGWGSWRHIVLPALTLSSVYVAYIARLTRGSLSEAMQADFIRTARSLGSPETRLLMKFGLRNALLPVITFSGPAVAFLITGTVVVEKIFAVPGLGNFFVQAATNRDYTLLLGIVLFVSVTLILMNLIVDLIYAVVDPRIRL